MTSGEALKQWRASRAGHFLLALLLLAATAFAIYARTTAFGLFADDYQWLGGARDFDVGRVWAFTSRTHFYRPLVDLYFRGAFILCGPSASCYHWLSLGLHVTTSLLVAALAAVVSGNPAIGLAAGVLFAAQPAPTEAVTWVSAVSEVLVTAFFVLTLLLFRSANASGRQAPYWFAVLTFTACLLTHESGVTLLPVMLLSTLLQNRGAGLTARPLKWVPFAVVWLAYGLVAYVVNSRNYLIAEGRYEIGPHMAINVIDALVSLSVARRELPGLVVMAMAFAWAVALAPGRIRFFAAWILITLLPVAPFHSLSSRYLYLPAAGFAPLGAELLWWARGVLGRWSRAGSLVWWFAALFLTVRFGAFAARNARALEQARVPYDRYVATVRALYPAPPPGARLEVPPPPGTISDIHVEPLLQWIYNDGSLTAIVRPGP